MRARPLLVHTAHLSIVSCIYTLLGKAENRTPHHTVLLLRKRLKELGQVKGLFTVPLHEENTSLEPKISCTVAYTPLYNFKEPICIFCGVVDGRQDLLSLHPRSKFPALYRRSKVIVVTLDNLSEHAQ